LVAEAKVKQFLLKLHNKLQLTLIKNKILLKKRQKHGILAKKTLKSRYFGKITAFDENHSFRDFLLSLIIVIKSSSSSSKVVDEIVGDC